MSFPIYVATLGVGCTAVVVIEAFRKEENKWRIALSGFFSGRCMEQTIDVDCLDSIVTRVAIRVGLDAVTSAGYLGPVAMVHAGAADAKLVAEVIDVVNVIALDSISFEGAPIQ